MRKILTILKERLQSLLAACPHTKVSRPFHDEDGDYQCCLDCGGRIQCSMKFGGNRPPWGDWDRTAPSLPAPEAVDAYLKTLEEKTP